MTLINWLRNKYRIGKGVLALVLGLGMCLLWGIGIMIYLAYKTIQVFWDIKHGNQNSK